jgi:hypothetical protein
MNEHPILFSEKMVRAILAGKKGQTRRIVKGTALDWLQPNMFSPKYVALPENYLSPYGYAGDLLWVRETFLRDGEIYLYKADFGKGVLSDSWRGHWKPSIHMPRKASRLALEITELRIERLNDISESDAIAEGATPSIVGDDLDYLKYRAGFQTLWNSINAKRGYEWESNPFVWVVSFQITRGITPREPDKN